jgi:hypothetical protein
MAINKKKIWQLDDQFSPIPNPPAPSMIPLWVNEPFYDRQTESALGSSRA